MSTTTKCDTPLNRCAWVQAGNRLYEEYHDTEWGVPVHDDRQHFEFLILEGAQAGLSWLTILKRRDEYRKAFANFDWEEVANFGTIEVEKLLKESGIVRNRAKIEATINNARQFLELRKEFGSFDNYVWKFVGGKPLQPMRKTMKEIPSQTKESQRLSKDLQKRGFKFVGPTIMYAHMQATGLINDHIVDCFRFKLCQNCQK
jgi:DNA-3-methyladenine glycosylase I